MPVDVYGVRHHGPGSARAVRAALLACDASTVPNEPHHRARGHVVDDAGPWALGRMCAVGRGGGPALRAAVDPRSGVGAATAF